MIPVIGAAVLILLLVIAIAVWKIEQPFSQMVLVPAGEFLRGSPPGEGADDKHPQKRVYVNAFNMDKYEVTTARYAEFLRARGREKQEDWDQVDLSRHGNLPVVGIDWHDAEAYCEWAEKWLPTEAEWEKAARGTDGGTYPWGNESPSARLANYGKEWSDNFYSDRLKSVDSYDAGKSPYGVHHMAGNAWEWVGDWWDSEYYATSPARNPKGPSNGEYKVLRGGSWGNDPGGLRSADRDGTTPSGRYALFGVRCAQDVP